MTAKKATTAKKPAESKKPAVKKADPVKEEIKTEAPATKQVKYKDSDIVEFVGNGTHPKLPARKPKRIEYATAKVLVGKGYGYIREE
jgi:hypothetical protein